MSRDFITESSTFCISNLNVVHNSWLFLYVKAAAAGQSAVAPPETKYGQMKEVAACERSCHKIPGFLYGSADKCLSPLYISSQSLQILLLSSVQTMMSPTTLLGHNKGLEWKKVYNLLSDNLQVLDCVYSGRNELEQRATCSKEKASHEEATTMSLT